MQIINSEKNKKEIFLIALALLSGILLLSASIVWEATMYVVNTFKPTQAYKYARSLSMGNNDTEVIFQTRSPVDRRVIVDRRSFHKQGYLKHNPERRINIYNRRRLRDRRELSPIIA